jgi:hypothetical protein
VVYEVIKAPPVNGAVYTIAPVTDRSKVRQVHRGLLKARLGSDAPVGPPYTSPPVAETVVVTEDDMDVDLAFLPPASLLHPVATPVVALPVRAPRWCLLTPQHHRLDQGLLR